jgi:hypothetical protein
VALFAALVESDEAESCVAGDCGVEVQSHSLLQRKHVAAAPAQAHEDATMAKNSIDAPACDGVEADGRCWYLSDQGESCDSTCLKHGRSFKFKTPNSGKPIMPMLLKKEPQTKEGPWRAFECYKPDDDHLHLVSKCSANDYRDNQGSWSDPSCQLACPCGGVKECSWKQPESCLPVFMHKDTQLTGCPKVDSDRPWCSHDHDKTDEWSYCVYTCTDASANGAIEMFSEPPFPEGAEEIDTLGAEETDKLSTDSVFLSSEGRVAYPASDAELTKDILDGVKSPKKSQDSAAATKDDLKEAKAPLQDSGIAGEQSTSKDDLKEAKAPLEDSGTAGEQSNVSEKKLVETHAAAGVDSTGQRVPVAASSNSADSAETEAEVVSTEKAAEGNPDGVDKSSSAGLTTEDHIQTVAFKSGDTLNHVTPDNLGNADNIGSQDEQVGFSKVVEQHNHSSDPETEDKENKENKESEEKEGKGKEEKKTEEDSKKDQTTTDESGGKETEKKSEDDASKNTTSEGSPEKNGSVQPINLLSCLTFTLIVGHVFAGSGM